MAARVRWRGTTTQRGYGTIHVHALKAARAAWYPGQPCAQCGRPIWQLWHIDSAGRRISLVDLGHTPDRSGYIGLCHRYCNRAEGASRGNRMRQAAVAMASARRW